MAGGRSLLRCVDKGYCHMIEQSDESTYVDDAQGDDASSEQAPPFYVIWKTGWFDTHCEAFEDYSSAEDRYAALVADEDARRPPRAALLTDESFKRLRFSGERPLLKEFRKWWQRPEFRLQARISHSKAELAALRHRREEEAREYERVSQIWSKKINGLQSEIWNHQTHIEIVANRLKELQERQDFGIIPLGPESLAWIDGPLFAVVASLIIITNMVTMVLELIHPRYQQELWSLDQFFLMFYIFELVTKALFFRSGLLCGAPRFTAWHWMDLIIVVIGVFDQWISPFVLTNSTGASYVSFLRVLRLARLTRVCKIFHILWKSEMAWAEESPFQSFIMGVISFNALLMGLEVETHNLDFVWFYVEQLLLMIFTFELIVRFKRHGLYFFTNADWAWNWLDFVIVAGGVLDQWMLPASNFALALLGLAEAGAEPHSLGKVMNLLRMARLLRILRLVRLIKNIPPLYNLVVGIAQAMQGMGWVMVLTSVVLYMCALVGVKLLGPAGFLWGGGQGDGGAIDKQHMPPEDVTSAFPDIFGAIFNLFKVMNADMSPMAALMQWLPAFKFVVMVYVIFTNWAIFSILTAVVSDHMARVTEETDSRAKETLERSAKELFVDRVFAMLDRDGSGEITSQELKALVDNPRECRKLCKFDATDPETAHLGSYLSSWEQADMQDFFQILGKHFDDEGVQASVTKQEFLELLSKESNVVNQRSIMRIEKRLENMDRDLRQNMRRMIKSIKKGSDEQRSASLNPSLQVLGASAPLPLGSRRG